jgi:hypothetical protein
MGDGAGAGAAPGIIGDGGIAIRLALVAALAATETNVHRNAPMLVLHNAQTLLIDAAAWVRTP